jgi:hypothetical protein
MALPLEICKHYWILRALIELKFFHVGFQKEKSLMKFCSLARHISVVSEVSWFYKLFVPAHEDGVLDILIKT